uniref:Testis development related protein n=1 Tax=Anser brachyrhynchus TaxID=132585 RepID=A0A8B9IBU1_9AVES
MLIVWKSLLYEGIFELSFGHFIFIFLWFCRGLILRFYFWYSIFHHSRWRFDNVLYVSSGLRFVLHCNHILSIFYYNGLNRIKAFTNTIKYVTADCPAETNCGPFFFYLFSPPLFFFFFENKDQFLHDEVPSSVSQLATKVQGASFRGWKEVTSMFNKDDEQQLLAGCKSPKSKGTNLKLKEEMKSEKKTGFWDSLVIKQNVQSRKPDEIEGWEPPQITAADSASDAATTLSDYTAWSGWEDETKGSTKYTNLASSGNSSRWSIKSAGKLVSIRRQSKGNLTDNWEELE